MYRMIAAEIELTGLTRRVKVEEAARVLLIRKDRGWKEVVAMLDGQAAARSNDGPVMCSLRTCQLSFLPQEN